MTHLRAVRHWSLVVFLGLIPVSASAQNGLPCHELNFPRLSFQKGVFTGIAIVNPTPNDATVTFMAYGSDGMPVQRPDFTNGSEMLVAKNQQIARTTAEIFNATPEFDVVGWVQACSNIEGLTGFFLYLNSPTTFLDGADLPPKSQKIIFNNIRSGNGFSTELNIINPGNHEANLLLQLYGDSSTPAAASQRTLAAKGALRVKVAELFGDTAIPEAASVVVTSSVDAPVAGFEFVTGPQDLLGLTARPFDELQQTLIIPQLAVRGEFRTEIGVTNYSGQEVLLKISAFQRDGILYGADELMNNPVSTVLPARASLREDAETLFGFLPGDLLDGWVKVEATAKAINGYVSYSTTDGSSAAVSSLPQPRSQALFSQLATEPPFFTGVAILNQGAFVANLRLVAFNSSGQLLGSVSRALRPRERLSEFISTLIPDAAGNSGGFIWFTSDSNLYLTSLFGQPNIGQPIVLANVPPQPVPVGFQPDGGLQNLVITPQQAVVAIDAAQSFEVDGAADVEWMVKGASLDENIGTINASGQYLAPTTPSPIPSHQPLIVTAQTDDAIGAANLVIYRPMALRQGLGNVQSVAFLRVLERIYTAELTALGGSSAKQVVAPLGEAQSSEIFEIDVGAARKPISLFPDENIIQMLPFLAKDNREYLILASLSEGRIIRLDPRSEDSYEAVKSDLDRPTAMAFDSDGNLAVFHAPGLITIERSDLEDGLAEASTASERQSSPARLRASHSSPRKPKAVPPTAFQGEGTTIAGAAVDDCSGDLYFSDSQQGAILRIKRVDGERETVVEGLSDPGRVLGLHRKDVGCPLSFQLLAVERGRDRVVLVDPSRSEFFPWIDAPGATDLIFLEGSTVVAERGAVIVSQVGEGPNGPGFLTLIEVPDLYQEDPLNTPDSCPGTIRFADAVLAELVRVELGLDTGAPIPCSPVGGLALLNADWIRGDDRIRSLQGIEFLTALQSLTLPNHTISDLSPLEALVSLSGISLEGNQISDIGPLSGLTALTSLKLERNDISDISALSSLTSLVSLDLGSIEPDGNRISDIRPLSNLTALTFLDLDRNEVNNIAALSGLNSLTTLDLSGNEFSDISPLSNLVALTVLDLGRSHSDPGSDRISDISPVAGLTALTQLILDGNEISDISALSSLAALNRLILANNNISDIGALVQNPGLDQGDHVELRGNPLDGEDCPDITALIERGVEVVHNAPCS